MPMPAAPLAAADTAALTISRRGVRLGSVTPGADACDWAHHLQSSEQAPSFPGTMEQSLTSEPNRSARTRCAQ